MAAGGLPEGVGESALATFVREESQEIANGSLIYGQLARAPKNGLPTWSSCLRWRSMSSPKLISKPNQPLRPEKVRMAKRMILSEEERKGTLTPKGKAMLDELRRQVN